MATKYENFTKLRKGQSLKPYEVRLRKLTKSDFVRNGQSLIELLVAMAVFILASAAVLILFFGGRSLSVDSRNAQQALDYATEAQEATRSIANRDWSELIVGNHGLIYESGQWRFDGESTAESIFTTTVTIGDIDVNTKLASTTVSWRGEGERVQKVELVQHLTQWQSPLVGGCQSDPLSGDWNNPQVLGSADLGPGNQGTDVVLDLPYVYMSGVASAANKPDLFVIDASNVVSPQIVRQVHIGAGGINSLYLGEGFLYGVSANDTREFNVFNTTNPQNTNDIANINLTGTADAIAIHGFENAVYVGRLQSSAAELVVIDVANPSAPSVTASFQINGNINSILATSQKLYVSTDIPDQNLWVYDLTNPLAPVLLAVYDLPVDDVIYGISIRLPGYLLASGATQFWVLDANDPEQIYVRDSLEIGAAGNDVICVADNLAFLATNNSTKEFVIVDISNPDNIIELASFNFPQVATGLDFADNKVFVSVRSNDALRIIGPSQ